MSPAAVTASTSRFAVGEINGRSGSERRAGVAPAPHPTRFKRSA